MSEEESAEALGRDACCKDKPWSDLERGDAPPSSARRFVAEPFARAGCFDIAGAGGCDGRGGASRADGGAERYWRLLSQGQPTDGAKRSSETIAERITVCTRGRRQTHVERPRASTAGVVSSLLRQRCRDMVPLSPCPASARLVARQVFAFHPSSPLSFFFPLLPPLTHRLHHGCVDPGHTRGH
jgi:hypothetical protein